MQPVLFFFPVLRPEASASVPVMVKVSHPFLFKISLGLFAPQKVRKLFFDREHPSRDGSSPANIWPKNATNDQIT